MLSMLRTTHMLVAGWRRCVDGVEIVWRCTCVHPLDTYYPASPQLRTR